MWGNEVSLATKCAQSAIQDSICLPQSMRRVVPQVMTIKQYNTSTSWSLAVIVTTRCIGSIANARSEVGTITP